MVGDDVYFGGHCDFVIGTVNPEQSVDLIEELPVAATAPSELCARNAISG